MADTVDSAPMRNIKVFVYGTLKRGHSNHRLLSRGNAEFLGRAYVEGGWRMLDLGAFPGVVRDGNQKDGRVFGEVFSCDIETLATLDLLEGHPSFYERQKVATPYGKAWMYYLNPKNTREDGLRAVTTGCWNPLQDEREWVRGTGGDTT
jgi:gamma-glutamylcyclotransferase (GGCT)/AIG2-like uncharacterized protein YtfP